MQRTGKNITGSVQKEIKQFNETFLKDSGGKKLTNVLKTNDGYLFIISSLPGPAYDKDNSKDYDKNKANTRQGKYVDIYIKSNATKEQDAFEELNDFFERKSKLNCWIQIENQTQIYFSSSNIITDKQNNLQEILRSALVNRKQNADTVNFYIPVINKIIFKKEEGNFVLSQINKEKGNFVLSQINKKRYNKIITEYEQKTKQNKEKGISNEKNEQDTQRLLEKEIEFKYFTKEEEMIPPIEAKKHELNLGSEKLLKELREKLEQENKERPPLSKIKSESIKNIIFEDEFRKFCIDNDIDKNKKLSDLNRQQIEEFKQRLNEAEHNYPCNIEKKIEEEQLLKDFFKDFEKKLSERIKEFLVEEKDVVNDNDAQEIEKILKEKEDKKLLFNEKDLTNLQVNGSLSNDEANKIYKSTLQLKKDVYRELLNEGQKYKNIKLDFGYDKQVFEGTVLRHNKNSKKKIKKLFFSESALNNATTPLHDNIQIISAYQCALGNNQMKIYDGDTMEDCHSRKYITGEDLEEKYEDLRKQITIDIVGDTRSHNRLRTNIFDSKQQKRFAVPISAKARIKYILTNIIDDNHVNNYFYKINDKNGEKIITEIIQFDYDKSNQKEKQDNIVFSFKTFNMQEENYILPWICNPYDPDDNSVNVKEELDIFLKEVNKIITIEPKMMFNIIAYRLSLTDVKVAEKLDVIHNLMIQHIDLLGKLQDKINNSLSSLEESKYHKNNIYRQYGEKLKYIAESVLPEKINLWKEKLEQERIIKIGNKVEKKNNAIEVMKGFFETEKVIPQIKKDIEEYNGKKEQNEKEERIKKEEEERIKKEEEERKKKEEEERKKKEEEKKKNSGQFHNTKNSILIKNLTEKDINENDKNLIKNNIPKKIDPNFYTNNNNYKKTNNTNNKTENTNKKQYIYNKNIDNSNINDQGINLEVAENNKQDGCCGGCSFFKFK